jgi:hypothetical protein
MADPIHKEASLHLNGWDREELKSPTEIEAYREFLEACVDGSQALQFV